MAKNRLHIHFSSVFQGQGFFPNKRIFRFLSQLLVHGLYQLSIFWSLVYATCLRMNAQNVCDGEYKV